MDRMTEAQAKIDTYRARLADPTIPADAWEEYLQDCNMGAH